MDFVDAEGILNKRPKGMDVTDSARSRKNLEERVGIAGKCFGIYGHFSGLFRVVFNFEDGAGRF